ncbi:hypothetical protein CAPN008_04360 [Capnocytophaga canis]|nr:hypothetical protein CAPN008_04360 [Capnocytophaga canis]
MFLPVKLPYALLSNISLIKNKAPYNVYITIFCLALSFSFIFKTKIRGQSVQEIVPNLKMKRERKNIENLSIVLSMKIRTFA